MAMQFVTSVNSISEIYGMATAMSLNGNWTKECQNMRKICRQFPFKTEQMRVRFWEQALVQTWTCFILFKVQSKIENCLFSLHWALTSINSFPLEKYICLN